VKKDATRQALILAGQLMLAVNESQSASTGSNVGSNDDIALARIAAGVFVVDAEAGTIHTADGQVADRPGRNGYREINLQHNERRSPAHRVVWLAAFGPIPPGRWEINHRNRKRDDNRIRNLELVLPTGNTDHWMGRTDYLRIGLDDEGAVDPRRLTELLAGLKSQTAGKRSRVIKGPNAAGVAMRAYRRR
jgi:hypothetical protein